jgi:hypothetical protein
MSAFVGLHKVRSDFIKSEENVADALCEGINQTIGAIITEMEISGPVLSQNHADRQPR